LNFKKDRFQQKVMAIPAILKGWLFLKTLNLICSSAPNLKVYVCLLSNLFETYSAEALYDRLADFTGTRAKKSDQISFEGRLLGILVPEAAAQI
tara:strand:- start:4464 stop:4745 length:282 start_codon:yes stop_codon:yes gene_type:complete